VAINLRLRFAPKAESGEMAGVGAAAHVTVWCSALLVCNLESWRWIRRNRTIRDNAIDLCKPLRSTGSRLVWLVRVVLPGSGNWTGKGWDVQIRNIRWDERARLESDKAEKRPATRKHLIALPLSDLAPLQSTR
jgi:hypothetical protein